MWACAPGTSPTRSWCAKKCVTPCWKKNVLLRELSTSTTPWTRTRSAKSCWPSPRASRPIWKDASAEIQKAQAAGQDILFEGAQGIHLDIDHGTYPFVTSSSTVASSAAAGSRCGPLRPGARGGHRQGLHHPRGLRPPSPTELEDDTGRYIQTNGHEFGATTGRPRRCGWLDIVILRETVRLCGLTDIALTKLDVLQNLPALQICVAYELDGQRLEYPRRKKAPWAA